MSALIQFGIAYCFGMLTFWFLEIQGFVILSMAVEAVLGGQMFPLDLMPEPVFRVAQYLPFYYQMYFPAAILTGRLGVEQVLPGLAIQACWAAWLLFAESPSIVTIRSLALTSLSSIWQERRTSPLTCTVQAPHCAKPQPNFGLLSIRSL